MSQSLILNSVLNEAKQVAQSGKQLKVVFDLDSTLFEVNPRIHKVLADFVEIYGDEFYEHCKPLRNFKLGHKDYGLKAALNRLGLDKSPPHFLNTLKEYWIKNFFSSDYLHHDEPYEGAVEFVREISAYANIIYLTGRDVERMGPGTERSLSATGFPLNTPNVQLVLKPNKEMDDALFKRDFLNNLEEPIWFFENEPENIHLVLRDCSHVKVIFFDSVHLGKAPAPEGLPTITSFAR